MKLNVPFMVAQWPFKCVNRPGLSIFVNRQACMPCLAAPPQPQKKLRVGEGACVTGMHLSQNFSLPRPV